MLDVNTERLHFILTKLNNSMYENKKEACISGDQNSILSLHCFSKTAPTATMAQKY